jgi:hypothetical protein
MYGVLNEVFGDFLEDLEIMALTDYLMTVAGLQQGTVRLHYHFQSAESSLVPFLTTGLLST